MTSTLVVISSAPFGAVAGHLAPARVGEGHAAVAHAREVIRCASELRQSAGVLPREALRAIARLTFAVGGSDVMEVDLAERSLALAHLQRRAGHGAPPTRGRCPGRRLSHRLAIRAALHALADGGVAGALCQRDIAPEAAGTDGCRAPRPVAVGSDFSFDAVAPRGGGCLAPAGDLASSCGRTGDDPPTRGQIRHADPGAAVVGIDAPPRAGLRRCSRVASRHCCTWSSPGSVLGVPVAREAHDRNYQHQHSIHRRDAITGSPLAGAEASL